MLLKAASISAISVLAFDIPFLSVRIRGESFQPTTYRWNSIAGLFLPLRRVPETAVPAPGSPATTPDESAVPPGFAPSAGPDSPQHGLRPRRPVIAGYVFTDLHDEARKAPVLQFACRRLRQMASSYVEVGTGTTTRSPRWVTGPLSTPAPAASGLCERALPCQRGTDSLESLDLHLQRQVAAAKLNYSVAPRTGRALLRTDPAAS